MLHGGRTAIEQVLTGDTSALTSVSADDLIRHSHNIIPLLKNLCSSSIFEDVNLGARSLFTIATSDVFFQAILEFFIEKIEQTFFSGKESHTPHSRKLCRFFTGYALNCVKTKTISAFQLCRDDILRLHTHLSSTAVSQSPSDIVDCIHILSRIDTMLSLMFKEATPSERYAWLLTATTLPTGALSSVVSFTAMCGMLREAHASVEGPVALELLTGMFHWLPGMRERLRTDTPLLRAISVLAQNMPDEYFVLSNAFDTNPDQAPFHRWWLVAVRLCSRIQFSPSFVSLVVATCATRCPYSLERVASMWWGVLNFLSPPKRDILLRYLFCALEFITDLETIFMVCSIFSLPLPTSQAIPPHLMMWRESAQPQRMSHFALKANLCPEYLATSLVGEGIASNDLQRAISTLCSPNHLAAHPSCTFHAFDALRSYVSKTPSAPDIHLDEWLVHLASEDPQEGEAELPPRTQKRLRSSESEVDALLRRVAYIVESANDQAMLERQINKILHSNQS